MENTKPPAHTFCFSVPPPLGRLGASTLLVGCALLAACSSGPEPTNDEPSAVGSRYSGVDTFRAAFFGEGPAGPLLAPFRNAHASSPPESREQIVVHLEHAIARMRAEGWPESAITQAQAALDVYRSGGEPDGAPDQVGLAHQLVVDRIAQTDATFFDRFGADMQSGDRLRVDAAMSEAQAVGRKALGALSHRALVASIPTFSYYAVYHVAAIYYNYFFDEADGEASSRLARAEMIDHYAAALAR